MFHPDRMPSDDCAYNPIWCVAAGPITSVADCATGTGRYFADLAFANHAAYSFRGTNFSEAELMQ